MKKKKKKILHKHIEKIPFEKHHNLRKIFFNKKILGLFRTSWLEISSPSEIQMNCVVWYYKKETDFEIWKLSLPEWWTNICKISSDLYVNTNLTLSHLHFQLITHCKKPILVLFRLPSKYKILNLFEIFFIPKKSN